MDEEEKVVITKYDTNITLGYKWASYYKCPLKFIILQEDNTALPIKESMKIFLDDNESLKDIYLNIIELNDSFTYTDAIMLFTWIALESEQKKRIGLSSEKAIEAYNTTKKYIHAIVNEFIDQLNEDKEGNLITQFEDFDTIFEKLKLWRESYGFQRQVDDDIFIKIKRRQEELDKINPYIVTVPVIEKTKMKFIPKWKNGLNVQISDGISIFNASVPSVNVPVIQYNNANNLSHYRILKNTTLDLEDFDSRASKPDTIYLDVCIGSDDRKNKKAKNVYTHAIITLGINIVELSIVCPRTINEENDGTKVLMKRLQDALPILDFDNGIATSIEGSFNIENFPINRLSLHNLVINDDLVNTYFFIDETSDSIANKKNAILAFRTLNGSIDANLSSSTTKKENASSVKIQFGNVNNNLRKIIVNSAKSKKELDQFIIIFSLLMRYYSGKKNNIEMLFKANIPGYSENIEDDEDISEKVDDTHIWKLRKGARAMKIAPEIFADPDTDYSADCQCPFQPIIINPEDAPSWKEMRIDGRERDVYEYPPRFEDHAKNYPRNLYVCPNDKYPYNSLKDAKSNILIEAGIRYIPCCGKSLSNQITAEQFYSNETVYHKANDKRKLITNKIVKDQNNPGNIQPILKIFFQSIIPVQYRQGRDFHRLFSPISYSSLIHCVLKALSDQGYFNCITNDEKELYVNKFRDVLANTINPAVYKQELYDMSEEDIVKNVRNPYVFFDPYLYYRGLEEYFKINIFVFNDNTPIIIRSNLISNNNYEIVEVPRFRTMHLRNKYLNRPSLIILKYLGSKSDNLLIPHCELITMGSHPSGYMFSQNMTELLYDCIKRTANSIVWRFPDNHTNNQNSNSIEMRKDPYSLVIWEDIFTGVGNKGTIISQSIDSYGKARSLNIRFNDKIVTVMILPSQPLNIPTSQNVYKINEIDVINIFGKPVGNTKDGVWYSILDIQYGIFIPVQFQNKNVQVTGPQPSIHFVENMSLRREVISNPITEIRNIRKGANTLIKLTEWAFRWSHPNKDIIDIWCDKYFQKDNTIDQTVDYPANIPFNLPKFGKGDKSEDAIKTASKWWPRYFNHNGKITLHDTLYDEMKLGLTRWYKSNEKFDIFPLNEITINFNDNFKNILIKLIKWVFRWSEPNMCITDIWCDKYLEKVDNKNSIFPNYSLIPFKLPHFEGKDDNSKQAIITASNWWPQYFNHNGKITLHDTLYIKIKHHLKKWYKHNEGLNILPSYQIEGMYSEDIDFINLPDSIVLIGKHFDEWLLTQHMNMDEKTVVLEKLDYTLAHREEPYIYKDVSTGKIYMVQNVVGSNKIKALWIAYNWAMTGYNSGYKPTIDSKIDIESLPYIVYGISENYNMIAIKNYDNSKGKYPFLQILSYSLDSNSMEKQISGFYAALLPIG